MRLRAGKRRAKSSNQINFDRLTWEDLPGQERYRRQAHDAFRHSGLGRRSDRAGRAGNPPSRHRRRPILVYGGSLLVAVVGLATALYALIGQIPTETLVLPVGLPWIGAHFRLDALSAFFLVVVNLGGAAASLYALGYGRHEKAPQRVLPFYPLFLAAMNLVVIADDAFTFLFTWEFMSLSSWALVMAHDQVKENVRAGFIYLLMASFGALALLLAFGLLGGPDGAYAFDAIRESQKSSALAALVLILALIGTGSKAGLVPLSRVAAARPPCRAEPCIRAALRAS